MWSTSYFQLPWLGLIIVQHEVWKVIVWTVTDWVTKSTYFVHFVCTRTRVYVYVNYNFIFFVSKNYKYGPVKSQDGRWRLFPFSFYLKVFGVKEKDICILSIKVFIILNVNEVS